MARSALYQAILDTESALDIGALSRALTGTNPTEIADKVMAVAAIWATSLTDLGAKVSAHPSRAGTALRSALENTETLIGEASDVVADLNFVFARIKQGSVPLAEERQAIRSALPDMRTARRALLTALAKLKPLVAAETRAARTRRPGIRADIDRDTG